METAKMSQIQKPKALLHKEYPDPPYFPLLVIWWPNVLSLMKKKSHHYSGGCFLGFWFFGLGFFFFGGVLGFWFFFFHCFKLLNILLSKQPNEVTFHKSTLLGGTFKEVKQHSKLSDKLSTVQCCKETYDTAARSVSNTTPFSHSPWLFHYISERQLKLYILHSKDARI